MSRGAMNLAETSTAMILSLCGFRPMIAWQSRRSLTTWGLERGRSKEGRWVKKETRKGRSEEWEEKSKKREKWKNSCY